MEVGSIFFFLTLPSATVYGSYYGLRGLRKWSGLIQALLTTALDLP